MRIACDGSDMATKRKGMPRDLNQLARAIVAQATGEQDDVAEPETNPDDGKDPHAVALGKKGGRKGGQARAAKLTPEQRTEIAKVAAEARWKKGDP